MTRQDRAVRTRRTLIDAAAVEFNRDGYHGTTLAQIAGAAEISMGALTFHFPNKAQLADAVAEEAWATARTVVEHVAGQPAPALQRTIALTLELTRLIEEEVLVRCAVRLSRERHSSTGWAEVWLPLVTSLAGQAHASGQLSGHTLPDDLTGLIRLLIGGCEVNLRNAEAAPPGESAVDRLRHSWRLVLEGIAPSTSAAALPLPGASADATASSAAAVVTRAPSRPPSGPPDGTPSGALSGGQA
ncbi:TetR family transcriptional regulator [Streptomyces sp. NPDC057376]|uniref:TetR family transcriptional regulator n=1 Tax=Streptomyces sp. NPDC057376 TaxID=3346110 RepID=UPI003643C7B4